MDGLSIGIIILLLFINLFFLIQLKRKNLASSAIEESMEEFVSQMELENEELYQKLVEYIKEKESSLEERIRFLEEKLESFGGDQTIEQEIQESVTEVGVRASVLESQDDRQHGHITKLYKQGFSPKQIAKVLQIDHGEVELVINMFKQQNHYK